MHGTQLIESPDGDDPDFPLGGRRAGQPSGSPSIKARMVSTTAMHMPPFTQRGHLGIGDDVTMRDLYTIVICCYAKFYRGMTILRA